MGSLPQLSVVKGYNVPLKTRFLHKVFEENVDSKYGQNVALVFKDHSEKERITSYNVLNSTTNRMAHTLLHRIKTVNKASANQDGDYVIAVCMKPSDNLIFTLLSIWKAGAAYLPIDPSFPINRIEHILNESKPVLVVHDDNVDSNIFGVDTIKFSVLKTECSAQSNANIPVEKTLNKGKVDLAIVLYTSGSTGVPKGVRLPHAIIQNRLEWQYQRFPYSPTETCAVFKTALTFVDSVTEIFGPLLNGLKLIVVPKEITVDPERLVGVLEKYRIERLVLVPTLLRSLLMYLPLQKQSNLLHNLKIWVCSGEPLASNLAKQFFNYFIEGIHVLCNFYGSTEVMGDVTYYVCENKKQLEAFDKVPIGIPVNNTMIYLLDANLSPVAHEQIGELYCSGLNLAKGYVNGRDPDRFIENPLAVDPTYSRLYRTGDFASLQKGIVFYEGRTDSQIKIRGHRVDLSEVEKTLTVLPGIDKGIVLCYHAGEIDQALLAFVLTNETEKEIYQNGLQIEDILKKKLPVYMVPQVILIDRVPLLVNGKVDRQSLLKMYENTNNNDDTEVVLEYDYSGIAESQLVVAKDLFETIGAVIGRSTRTKITKDVNFYELGGNSLNSIFTVTQLRDKGYYISITNFIAADNLGQILAHICDPAGAMTAVDLMFDANDDNLNLQAFPLAVEHKDDTINIITTSFFEKADLEQWLKPNIKFTDYGDILGEIWEILIEKGLSFIVKDGNGRSVGVSMNFDARDEPEVHVTSKLIIVFEFLEFVEGPIRDNQLPEGKILHSFMMGTSPELNAQENITVMNFMESEVLALAHSKNFAGIFTTNTNPLTQQLGSVYGYKTMLDYQVNQYTYSDGSKPFGKAPAEQRAIVHWKDIRQ